MRHQISLVHMNALDLVVQSVEVATEERGAPDVVVERDHIHLIGHQPLHSQIVVPRVAVHLQCSVAILFTMVTWSLHHPPSTTNNNATKPKNIILMRNIA